MIGPLFRVCQKDGRRGRPRSGRWTSLRVRWMLGTTYRPPFTAVSILRSRLTLSPSNKSPLHGLVTWHWLMNKWLESGRLVYLGFNRFLNANSLMQKLGAADLPDHIYNWILLYQQRSHCISPGCHVAACNNQWQCDPGLGDGPAFLHHWGFWSASNT